jgi:hypothetical protein
MSSRPYARKSGAELQALFESGKTDEATLKRLAKELKHRHVPTARTLASKVVEALNALNARTEPEAEGTRDAGPEPEQKAHDRIITCKGCAARLRVRLIQGVHRMHCPTCKMQFTASFENDVLSVEFDVDRDINGKENKRITLEDAYRLFAATSSTPWEHIEKARRRLIQQYHPDKVAALGPKLREVAEAEGKRINQAFDLLRTARGL